MRIICAGLLVLSAFVAVRAYETDAAITITTNGTVAEVTTFGGDVGYPGPSSVVIERDSLGLVVVSRTRLFVPLKEKVWLPGVSR